MKVIFLEDTIPIKEMFLPIIKRLLSKPCVECMCVGYDINVNKILKEEKPDLVVLAREETNPIEHQFAISGTQTLLIPHGLLMPNERELWGSNRLLKLGHVMKLIRQFRYKIKKRRMPFWKLIEVGLFRLFNDFKDNKSLSKYDNFTKIAVYGESMRDILLKYKVKPENIVITGNPKYDKYINVSNKKSGRILLITDYLVEFGLWSEKQRLEYLQDVSDVVYKLTSNKVDILIHPVLEDKEDYEGIISKHHLMANVYQLELANLINECDMAITVLSTSGIEMMVANKPLVIYNPYHNPTLYDQKSGCYFAYNKNELYNVLKDVIQNGMSEEKQRLAQEFIYNKIYKQDGKSVDRIVDLILGMGDVNCLKISLS